MFTKNAAYNSLTPAAHAAALAAIPGNELPAQVSIPITRPSDEWRLLCGQSVGPEGRRLRSANFSVRQRWKRGLSIGGNAFEVVWTVFVWPYLFTAWRKSRYVKLACGIQAVVLGGRSKRIQKDRTLTFFQCSVYIQCNLIYSQVLLFWKFPIGSNFRRFLGFRPFQFSVHQRDPITPLSTPETRRLSH